MTKRDRETAVENVLKRWRKLQEEVKAVEDDAANMAFSQGSGDPPVSAIRQPVERSCWRV